MNLDKIDINIDKLGDLEVFSYNGYMLGFRDRKDTNSISFASIVIDKKYFTEKDLCVYFDFIDMAWAYSYYDYEPSYDIYFKEYNKVYNNCDRYDVIELMKIAPCNNVCITPDNSLKIINLVDSLINEFSLENKTLIVNFDEDKKRTIKTLSLNEDDYVRIIIDYFEQYFISYNGTSKEIKDIVKTFKCFFKMLNKNFGKGNLK